MRVSDLSASIPADCQGSGDRVDVSVLVPVFNEERHIRETVAAMQAQRFDGAIELLRGEINGVPAGSRELAALFRSRSRLG